MNQHIACLKKACQTLGINYIEVGKSTVFLSVDIKGKPYHFIANAVPFNDFTVTKIACDKSYTYELLSPVIRMPLTRSYLDPNCDELFQPYVTYQSQAEIFQDIKKNFKLPIVLKKNSGARGELVFACQTDEEVKKAIASIFNKNSHLYDYILLAQEHITIKKEFRVTVFDKEIFLIYEKDISEAQFVGNLSPLHWEGALARLVEDDDLKKDIAAFIAPLFEKLDLEYGGLDVAIDEKGHWCLFEINVQPGYGYLLKSYGEEPLVTLYTKMLQKLLNSP